MGNNGTGALAFSPDGKTLAAGSYDKAIKLWNVATRKNTVTLRGLATGVISLAYSPDGKTLASRGTVVEHPKLLRMSKDLKGFLFKYLRVYCSTGVGLGASPLGVAPFSVASALI